MLDYVVLAIHPRNANYYYDNDDDEVSARQALLTLHLSTYIYSIHTIHSY